MKHIFAAMLRTFTYIPPEKNNHFNLEAAQQQFTHVCLFDSNLQTNVSRFLCSDKIIALGCHKELRISKSEDSLAALQQLINEKSGWLFGYLSYDLKNEIEALTSSNSDGLNFPLLHFFVPEVVIQINESSISVSYNDDFLTEQKATEICNNCFQKSGKKHVSVQSSPIDVHKKMNKEAYLEAVNKLKEHIQKGDIYEANYCQEFFAENTSINTVQTFEKLNAISKAPFSAYCRFNNHYILSASPERYLKKTGTTLITQPIKGTGKRSENKDEDEVLKNNLKNSSKERSENIMIVDLVRNDLSRIAKPGTVRVEELLGIYTYRQVHQLISTVSCELPENILFADIIKSTFPMGSMTGAPKVSALTLIEKHEQSMRGVYSGAIGYISPSGDFDFNVVIRSILYNAENNYLSFSVGSAITAQSKAEEEYEECMIKAKAMLEVLGASY